MGTFGSSIKVVQPVCTIIFICLFLQSIIADITLNLIGLPSQYKTDSDWPLRFIGCKLIGQGPVVMFNQACKSNTGNKHSLL